MPRARHPITTAETKLVEARRPRRRRIQPLAIADAFVDSARTAGLLDGERAEHLSFRAPAALVAAAKRETGIQSTTELGIAALAALAQPDPVAALMRKTRGALAGLEPIEP